MPYVPYSNLNFYCQEGQLNVKSIGSNESERIKQKAKGRAYLNSSNLLEALGDTISCGGLEPAKIVGQ